MLGAYGADLLFTPEGVFNLAKNGVDPRGVRRTPGFV